MQEDMNGTGSNSDFNLDRLKAETGALRVISGSHKQPFHDRLDKYTELKIFVDKEELCCCK